MTVPFNTREGLDTHGASKPEKQLLCIIILCDCFVGWGLTVCISCHSIPLRNGLRRS